MDRYRQDDRLSIPQLQNQVERLAQEIEGIPVTYCRLRSAQTGLASAIRSFVSLLKLGRNFSVQRSWYGGNIPSLYEPIPWRPGISLPDINIYEPDSPQLSHAESRQKTKVALDKLAQLCEFEYTIQSSP